MFFVINISLIIQAVFLCIVTNTLLQPAFNFRVCVQFQIRHYELARYITETHKHSRRGAYVTEKVQDCEAELKGSNVFFFLRSRSNEPNEVLKVTVDVVKAVDTIVLPVLSQSLNKLN